MKLTGFDTYTYLSVLSFSDSLLASILSPKEAMCNKNFTLAIDDILFVGFPTVLKDLEVNKYTLVIKAFI